MTPSYSSVFAAAALFATSVCLPLRAASEAEAAAGRELVKRYADAIVGVELVVTIKLKVGGNERPPQEQRIEVNGTVISPSGLTVTSLAEVDPQALFDAVRSGGGRGAELVGAEFKEVKLRLADGKEVPARFVLKDADLDLAFMAPDVTADASKPDFPSYVKLDESAEGVLLGNYFFVARERKVLQRVPIIRASEVAGIVEKPRRFYLVTAQTLGTPVFDLKGKVLGISVNNFANGRPTGLVVLPAGDIAEIAKQAAAIQAQPKPVEVPRVEVPPIPSPLPATP
ncbi:MAG: S1C family serine protease [Opitutaceae bacterium]